jgi:hypothetical protein
LMPEICVIWKPFPRRSLSSLLFMSLNTIQNHLWKKKYNLADAYWRKIFFCPKTTCKWFDHQCSIFFWPPRNTKEQRMSCHPANKA